MVPFIDSLLSEIFATDIKGLKQKKKISITEEQLILLRRKLNET